MEHIATVTSMRMAKRLLVLMAVLAAMLAATALPALAQEGDGQGEAADAPPDPPSSEAATLSFELAVEGNPPADATFLAFVGGEGGAIRVPLTDPDGDNLYTGSTTTDGLPVAYVRDGAYVTIVDTSVVAEDGGPRVIRDFGVVPVDEDETFSASVSFEGDPGEPNTPGVPSPQDRTATFDFELTVEGTPPEGARFFGAVPAEGCISVPLTDQDRDGVFTGSLDVPRFAPGPVPPPDAEPVSLPVQIVQADSGASPCDPTTMIRDFGTVPANDDTFRASTSFEGNGGGTTTPEPGNDGVTDDNEGPDNGGSGNSDGFRSSSGSDSCGSGSGGSDNNAASGGSPSGMTSGITGLLPSTGGGVALWVLGAGILLIGGGLLVRKLAR